MWLTCLILEFEAGQGHDVFMALNDAEDHVPVGYLRRLRIPEHADHDSGMMSIMIPGSCRSEFRGDGDQDSGLMPIKNSAIPEC